MPQGGLGKRLVSGWWLGANGFLMVFVLVFLRIVSAFYSVCFFPVLFLTCFSGGFPRVFLRFFSSDLFLFS